ncbi:MAG: M28 family peptidase [Saprospiraceae bacterium]|nr:M28 family peptidase [Saprospiraceae bacterium]
MKKYPLLFTFLLGTLISYSQNQTQPEQTLSKAEMEAHLRFLASDDLKGRRTGEPGNDIAAAYIAAQLAAYGYQPLPGAEGYYQPVPLEKIQPPVSSSLQIGKTALEPGKNFLILGGGAVDIETQAVFAGQGWVDEATGHDDYKGLDVKGKIVFVLPGTPEGSDPGIIFRAMKTKPRLAEARGAVALIELYRMSFPWGMFSRYFGQESLQVTGKEAPSQIAYGWLKEPDKTLIESIQNNIKTKVKISSSGLRRKAVHVRNVAGVLPGADPQLKEEYILLTAHFDHVGTGAGPEETADTIYNGARDNGMGTVALLAAAKSLALQPPARSVIVLAVNAEEVGLLGSQYYAENPLIPLDKTVFNLNTDGAGYNDTTVVAIVGHGRTGADAAIGDAAQTFGLGVFPNPAPEQNLFDRSDNVSFARKGMPAVCFSPGATGFDEEIGKYYHQTADNPETINFDYLQRFCQTFALTARHLANTRDSLFWKAGDKYEKAGRELYNR